MKNNANEFFEKPIVKLISIIILTLLLILISLILFEDLNLDSSMLIYNIFGTITLVGFLYSFHTTNKKLYIDVSLGICRKDFYKKYLKNTLFILFITLFFITYYIFLYRLIIANNKLIFEEFKIERFVYLSTIFLCLSFLGFLFGILKMKSGIFYPLVFVIVALIVLSLIYLTILYLLSILFGIVSICLGVLNYYIIKNINL